MFEAFLTPYDTFKDAGIDNPLLETLRLLNILSNGALRQLDDLLQDGSIDIHQLVHKRQAGVPLEYALGQATFMGLELLSSPAALIPREETELLVRTALEFVHRLQKETSVVNIIDIGTGSGNIAIALAAHTENTHILASDVSAEAVSLAQENVEKHALQERISLFSGDLFAPLAGKGYEGNTDVIVCNPPYIPTGSLVKLPAEVVDHEPIVALDAGAYGINIFRRLVRDALSFLKPGGLLTFEIGLGQEVLAGRLLQNANGYCEINTVADEQGNARVMCALRK